MSSSLAHGQPGPDRAPLPPPYEEEDELFIAQPPVTAPRPLVSKPKDPPWRHDFDGIVANSLGLFAVGMWGRVSDYPLAIAVGQDEPDPLRGAELALDGVSGLAGGGFRGMFQSAWGIRFGLGFSSLYGDGFSLVQEGLPDGVSAELDGVTIANFEVALGKAFDATYLYPYIDVKMGINVMLAQIAVRTEQFGYMGSSTYVVPSLSVGPRAGVFVPLDGDWFIDVSGQYSFVGVERGGLFAGFGFWDD